ncbi:MAG: ABC transporter substrate-binding protein [Dehalococcoidia bacterium]
MNVLRVGVPALSQTFEIGGVGTMDMKPTLYESLVGYQLEPYSGGLYGAAIRRSDRFSGRLAERWNVSDDGRTIEMTLREGVRSVAGNHLSSEDVKYTIDRGFQVPGYYQWTAQVAGLQSNEDVEVVDGRTVRFHLATPSAFFLDTRAFPMNGIFDSTLLREMSTADDPWAERFVAANDAGFGPYTIEEIRPGEGMTYRAREDYYRGMPAFDRIAYRVIPDAEERERRLAAGDLDHALGLSTAQLLRLSSAPQLRVVFGPNTSVFHLSLGCGAPPFDDVHLRRAVAYAVPYQAILDEVLLGVARPWRGFIPPVVDGYDESGWPYQTDLERARKELALALRPDKPIEIICDSGQPIQQPTAQRIVSALAEIGLAARVTELSVGDYYACRQAKQYAALLSGAGPMVPDAGYQLSHDYCTTSEGNDFGYRNPEVDSLVERGLATADPVARKDCYDQAQRLLTSDVPVVPLASLGFAMVLASRVAGAAWYPDNVLHYGELRPA